MEPLDRYYLAAQQLAVSRLLPDPSERFSRDRPALVPNGEACGICPDCRNNVVVTFPASGDPVACPSCCVMIDSLESPEVGP